MDNPTPTATVLTFVPPADREHERIQEAVNDPHRLARHLLHTVHVDAAHRVLLRHWRGEWWRWDGKRCQRSSKGDLEAVANGVIKAEFDRHAQRRHDRALKVGGPLVRDTMAALSSLVLVPSDVEQPAWLGNPPTDRPYLALQNGLLAARGRSTDS